MNWNSKKTFAMAALCHFFFLLVIVPYCILSSCLSLPSNHCAELKNNLLLVSSAEWILLLIVEVNMLFEYDQSPVIKGLLWFMKYSSKVSPGDWDAFRCISQNLKQTLADKSFWATRQAFTRGLTPIVHMSPCSSAGFQPLHLLINQQERTPGFSSQMAFKKHLVRAVRLQFGSFRRKAIIWPEEPH